MVSAIGTLNTESASKYLQQLCKHFSHKLKVSFTPAEGHIEFPFGQCELKAQDNRLTLKAISPDQENLTKLKPVIESHLKRFAFREEEELKWGEGI